MRFDPIKFMHNQDMPPTADLIQDKNFSSF